jgi:hypothetical protein
VRFPIALALSFCLVAACSSSGATTCPVPKEGDLPSGGCSADQSCPEIVTRVVCPYGPEVGPSIVYACSCQQGGWRCVEAARSKSACNPAPGPDAGTSNDGAASDGLEPGACPGPNPRSCHFGGGASGICDHVGHAATCRDGAWVCTDDRGTPLVPASQCRCFVTSSAVFPCRCENGAAICGTPDAAADGR